jgi:hypothetical protein
MQIALPSANGAPQNYTPTGKSLPAAIGKGFTSRIAYAAAHVVIDPLRTIDIATPVVDWDSKLAFRQHLWSLGFGVAEAMDTAQRGSGLAWPQALELIQRSVKEARAVGGRIASGAGTDHLNVLENLTLDDVTNAYLEQCAAVEAAGSRIILMASRALAKVARSPEDYHKVYGAVLRQIKEPVILHWLGPMFDPALEGYWGSASIPTALESCLALIREHTSKIDGIKISMLSAELEIEMRRKLPPGVRMYTGDDFNYDALILGDAEGHSDALLGIFDAIAPAAALALEALDAGDRARYEKLLAPTIPLSRHIFHAPTHAYKTGVVFLAYLNGFQQHFRMLAGAESARSVPHMIQLFKLADQAGLLHDPDLAVARMRTFLTLAGA